jgi:hypothetical protein
MLASRRRCFSALAHAVGGDVHLSVPPWVPGLGVVTTATLEETGRDQSRRRRRHRLPMYLSGLSLSASGQTTPGLCGVDPVPLFSTILSRSDGQFARDYGGRSWNKAYYQSKPAAFPPTHYTGAKHSRQDLRHCVPDIVVDTLARVSGSCHRYREGDHVVIQVVRSRGTGPKNRGSFCLEKCRAWSDLKRMVESSQLASHSGSFPR